MAVKCGGAISRVTGIEVGPTRGTGWIRVNTRGATSVTVFEVSDYSVGVLLSFGGELILVSRVELISVLEDVAKRLREME